MTDTFKEYWIQFGGDGTKPLMFKNKQKFLETLESLIENFPNQTIKTGKLIGD